MYFFLISISCAKHNISSKLETYWQFWVVIHLNITLKLITIPEHRSGCGFCMITMNRSTEKSIILLIKFLRRSQLIIYICAITLVAKINLFHKIYVAVRHIMALWLLMILSVLSHREYPNKQKVWRSLKLGGKSLKHTVFILIFFMIWIYQHLNG